MKRRSALFVVLVMSGSPIAAQAPASTSPQPAPPVIAPAPGRPSSQAQNPTGASRPGVTASGLGPIVATGDSVAYVSAESAGHPVVFLGSDASPYGIVGTLTNHPLGFRTNDIARMFIDTSGNIGIGTMTPGFKLDVAGDANITGTYRVNGVPISATSYWTQANAYDIYYTNTTGRVGIGTITPSKGTLHVAGGKAVFAEGSVSGIEASGGLVGVEGDSTSGVGVNGSTFSGTAVRGSTLCGGSGYAGYFEGKVGVTGAICAANVSCASDARLKQDIRPLSYGLREVLRLRPARWQWKDPSTRQVNFGLVAQDVEPVLPELILHNVDTNGSLGLHYTGLIPILINAIQEQQDTIGALKAENMSLDARIRALEQALMRSRPER